MKKSKYTHLDNEIRGGYYEREEAGGIVLIIIGAIVVLAIAAIIANFTGLTDQFINSFIN